MCNIDYLAFGIVFSIEMLRKMSQNGYYKSFFEAHLHHSYWNKQSIKFYGYIR